MSRKEFDAAKPALFKHRGSKSLCTACIFMPLFAVSGCDVFSSEDPRTGMEVVSDCTERVASNIGPTSSYRKYDGTIGVPIFTYDITKLSLDDTQTLILPESDETAGSRLMASTNEESTAVDTFMNLDVDSNGAFFLARDPALYRVRGAQQRVESMIETGCARQKAGMRLIAVDIVSPPATDTSPEQETDN